MGLWRSKWRSTITNLCRRIPNKSIRLNDLNHKLPHLWLVHVLLPCPVESQIYSRKSSPVVGLISSLLNQSNPKGLSLWNFAQLFTDKFMNGLKVLPHVDKLLHVEIDQIIQPHATLCNIRASEHLPSEPLVRQRDMFWTCGGRHVTHVVNA